MTVWAIAESVPDDLRPWGLAPGWYMFQCIDCPKETSFAQKAIGAKRSMRCRNHAVDAWRDSKDDPTPSQTVSQDRAVERFYIDCEFDGHNGPLLSIAIVSDHSDGIQIRTTERAKDDWVAANVEPLMDRHRAPETALVRSGQVGGVIRAFIGDFDGVTIIADSPVDITRFCQAITTDADGNWASVDGNLKFEVHDINCYPTDLPGAVQHNAWWDAMALRHKLAAFKKIEVGHE